MGFRTDGFGHGNKRPGWGLQWEEDAASGHQRHQKPGGEVIKGEARFVMEGAGGVPRVTSPTGPRRETPDGACK